MDRSTFRQGASACVRLLLDAEDNDAEREVENWASGNLGVGFRVRMEALPEWRGRWTCWCRGHRLELVGDLLCRNRQHVILLKCGAPIVLVEVQDEGER